MSIEQAIHQRWATDANLSALLTAERLFTGTAPGNPPLPYAVLTRLGGTPLARTSSGTAVDDVRIELAVWTADLESGQRIAIEVDRRFEHSAFALGDERVLLMRRADRSERLEADAVWRTTLTYLVMHELPQPGITSHV